MRITSPPRRYGLALSSLLLFLLPIGADAQSLDAVLIGTVVDHSGAGLPGVSVIASADDTGTLRSAISDRDGRYKFLNLPPATYTVRAELDGFAPSIRQGQTLHVGTTVMVDFVLAVAGVAETVTVRGALAALESSVKPMCVT
jgi:hypothetical protein